MKNLISIIIYLSLSVATLFSQTATIVIDNVYSDAGTTVGLPVFAQNISYMTGFQWTIEYDNTKLTYLNCSDWGGGANQYSVFINNLSDEGKLTFAYNSSAVNIADDLFFNINFDVSADATGTIDVIWSDNPTPRELSNSVPEVISANWINGSIIINSETYTITATVFPANTGNVTGAGTYNFGDNATLEASPNVGYNFINWTENDIIVSEAQAYTFSVTANRNLIANFENQTYTITATVFPANTGNVTGAGTYNFGDNATLEASPNVGYNFINWTENDIIVSEAQAYTFSVTANRNLIANFENQTYTITATVFPANTGNVTGAGTYNYGEIVTLEANVLDSNYVFESWHENDIIVSYTNIYTFTATADRDFVAFFHFKENISEYNISEYLIYPNPAKDFLYVEADNLSDIKKIELFYSDGKKVHINIKKINNKYVINLQDQKTGIYVLKISGVKNFSTYKILKN